MASRWPLFYVYVLIAYKLESALPYAFIIHESLIFIFGLVEIAFTWHGTGISIVVQKQILVGVVALLQLYVCFIQTILWIVVHSVFVKKTVAGPVAVDEDVVAVDVGL